MNKTKQTKKKSVGKYPKNKTYMKRSQQKRKIHFSKSNIQTKKSDIVIMFIEILNTVKLYHWKTHSYAQHKATDELYSNLNGNIDKFVEVMLGKDESRIKTLEKRIRIMNLSNVSDFKNKIYEFRQFLIDLNLFFDEKKDSDILSIRDDILVDINQFLYLMTFDK